MARRYRRYRPRRALKTARYSNETVPMTQGVLLTSQTAENVITDYFNNENNIAVEVVGATTAQGMRKVKNFTLNMVIVGSTASGIYAVQNNFLAPVYWALVYVPQGQDVSDVTPGGVSLYEPNQNVIMSGILQPNDNVITKRTRLARNLNSGDKIYFCYVLKYLADPLDETGTDQNRQLPFQVSIQGTCNYAICYS